ncbi:hypothetical protein N7474_010409 [Penicillium riverlandense]|uniref:uncharacterized protein n=1 Tax=Penicillium riverlandense TaxID=1903569 RepID=UPI00254986EB|nr:uncharacterized protein N7474_010409 [Penicillium riverlandense]KAJ5806817.1 hypothetical protein N7474_010409 [Penicillium riverlandense]
MFSSPDNSLPIWLAYEPTIVAATALQRASIARLSLSPHVVPQGYAGLVTVPTTPFTKTGGTYDLSKLTHIIIDSGYANEVDHHGQTLIPPTLSEFVETFQEDLKTSLGLDLQLVSGTQRRENTVFVTLGNSTSFRDAAGRWTSEGYDLRVDDHGIIVTGASPLGAWWATRSMIQAAVNGDSVLAKGAGADAPGWGTRGVFLDAGRHFYPADFLVEMCSYLSFFKQNTFHVHLSDNLNNNVKEYSRERSLELYAAFRLWSEDPAVAGLNRRQNESYTREQFDHIQTQCAKRGVTIIPEIETPGHALVIVQWKPELGLEDLSMLNLSHPDTLPTVKTIWKTFLPWFHSKVVHIGADEYNSSLVADYTQFVNDMNTFIMHETGGRKSMRIWGTFTPKEGANVSKSISYQHWANYDDHPYWDYIQNGYNVLNSDNYLYLVGGWSASYPQELELSRIFQGPYGSGYSPVIMDSSSIGDNPPRNNKHVLGQVAALWNDYGPNSTTVLQAYYSWRNALPALADKQWGGNITEEEYHSVFDALHAVVPAQNLDRSIPSESDTILQYIFDGSSDSTVTDHSGNEYHGRVHGCKIADKSLHLADGCYLETPLGSKGRDYTLSFRVKPTSQMPGTLFEGPDSIFVNGNGTISNATLISGGNPYSLNYSLPLNTWTDVSLVGEGNTTRLTVGKGSEAKTMEFLTKIGNYGEYFEWAPIAVEAPLTRVGEGFTGLMQNIVLKGSAY